MSGRSSVSGRSSSARSRAKTSAPNPWHMALTPATMWPRDPSHAVVPPFGGCLELAREWLVDPSHQRLAVNRAAGPRGSSVRCAKYARTTVSPSRPNSAAGFRTSRPSASSRSMSHSGRLPQPTPARIRASLVAVVGSPAMFRAKARQSRALGERGRIFGDDLDAVGQLRRGQGFAARGTDGERVRRGGDRHPGNECLTIRARCAGRGFRLR